MGDHISFRTMEDFVFEIGKDKIVLNVPRMDYLSAQKVLEAIAGYEAEERAFTLKTLGKAKKSETFMDDKNWEDFSKFLVTSLPTLALNSSFHKVKKLLNLISNDIIKDEHLKMMQYEEAVSILTYLIENNFGALKNLSASLQTIDMSVKK